MTNTTALLIVLSLFVGLTSRAQEKEVSGRVLDAKTHAPLSGVSVRVRGVQRGTLTDSTGGFHIALENGARLQLSLVGYAAKTVQVPTGPIILMTPAYTDLEDVNIRIRKRGYRNKNNPAVELIREVIRHKAENELSAYAYATFRQYDKTVLSADNWPRALVNARPLKRYHFIFENVDTTTMPGKRLIPIYIAETYSQQYIRNHPSKKKTLVLGQKSVDYGEFVDTKGLAGMAERLYGPVDLYQDKMDLFGTQLLSPISDAAPTFYMYFILDTLRINGVPVVKMSYMPRNPDDLLFRGTLYIPLDGHYSVQRAELGVSKHININFVRSFKINLDYTRDSAGHYYMSRSDMLCDLGIYRKGIGGFGERVITNSGFQSGPTAPDSLFKGYAVDSAAQASAPPDSIWAAARNTPLSNTEIQTYHNIDSLGHMRSYHRLMDFITMCAVGYKQAGIFNIGPINTFYSYNPVEGSKPKFGGRTTPKLSKSFYAETYVAYGLKDQQWKYDLNLSYSFNHRSIFNSFPLHYVQAGFQRDTKIPGQLNNFSSVNTFQTSFTQGPNDQWLYNDIFHADYFQEYRSHFSYDLGYQYWRQQPAGTLEYLYPKNAGFDTVHQITTSSLAATVRWAPHEQFILNQVGRSDVINRYPIISLSYARGFKGPAGGQYNCDALHLNVYKRFYLAPIGFTDVTLDAGYISGRLPFPLLFIHPANETYVYYTNAYNLMNFEEFVSDHYAGINFDHYFNGFFLNKIPGIKWLKLREVIAAKVLYGGVRAENDPTRTPGQMAFPTINGVTSTFVLNRQPYVEGSIGIANIFKVIRVDLVRRMTYLEHPYVSAWGIRFSSNFTF